MYCQYCGLDYTYAVCPYDGTTLPSPWDLVCSNPTGVRHNLHDLPEMYRLYQNYISNSVYQNLAACPNCKTPYFYSILPTDLQEEFKRQRQATACFIAAAAFGSHLNPTVESLRWFRDNVLLQSRHRHSFENLLNFYYEFSPPIARAMTRHKSLKLLLRYTLVYPTVFGIKVVLPMFNIVLGIERDSKKRKSLL